MIGDSLRSDVAGAKRAGLDACWFNPLKKPFDGEVQPDFSVCRLDELLQIL
jgi:2-haloacid dehalogenase